MSTIVEEAVPKHLRHTRIENHSGERESFLREVFERWRQDNQLSPNDIKMPNVSENPAEDDAGAKHESEGGQISVTRNLLNNIKDQPWAESYLRYIIGHEYHHVKNESLETADYWRIGAAAAVAGAVISGLAALLPFKNKSWSLIPGAVAGTIAGFLKYTHRKHRDETRADHTGLAMAIAGQDKATAEQTIASIREGRDYTLSLHSPSRQAYDENFAIAEWHPKPSKRLGFIDRAQQQLATVENPKELDPFFASVHAEQQQNSSLANFLSTRWWR